MAAIIEGQGGESAINAVYYENLDGSPSKEIVVSWQVSGDQRQILSVYAIQGRTVDAPSFHAKISVINPLFSP